MLRSLRIENFRCFQKFEIQTLGKLNLLVGTNNSGKTSILEAVQLLNSQSNLESLQEVMLGRGEYILNDERGGGRELDVRHLFYGHEIHEGSKFSIFGNNHNDGEGITVSVEQQSGRLSLFEDLQEFVLAIEWVGQENERIILPLSSKYGLSLDYVRRVRRDL